MDTSQERGISSQVVPSNGESTCFSLKRGSSACYAEEFPIAGTTQDEGGSGDGRRATELRSHSLWLLTGPTVGGSPRADVIGRVRRIHSKRHVLGGESSHTHSEMETTTPSAAVNLGPLRPSAALQIKRPPPNTFCQTKASKLCLASGGLWSTQEAPQKHQERHRLLSRMILGPRRSCQSPRHRLSPSLKLLKNRARPDSPQACAP